MSLVPQSLALTLGLLVSVSAAFVHATEAPFEPWKTSADPVAKMWERVCNGRTKLDVSDQKAWVLSALHELGVPEESQVLVFSKTSLQTNLISPQTPRSVFFNEETYVGWVPGGLIELIGIDPVQGPQFYTMSLPSKAVRPVLEKSEQCLSCHEGSRTDNVKGMMVRSMYVDADGQPIFQYGSFLSGHESPLSERWGGWYVTGRSGRDQHMGNIFTASGADGQPQLDRSKGTNILSLDRFFDTKPYLEKTSDIVALMVLEHQCTMHNRFTEAGKAAREAMARQKDLQKAFGEPITNVPQGTALSIIQSEAGKVVRHLLFCGEYPLQDGGIEGGAAFQDAFRKNRHETADGRSLKDFQLLHRLFKNQCSYMIYSKSFEALPAPLKNEIYTQLWRVVSGQDQNKDFNHLSASERQYIREIIAETKSDLPACWKAKA